MGELDCKESWALKNWCFWTVVLEKTLESPLDCKEIQTVHPKGNQSWIFIGRTDIKAETATLWPPDAKNWLMWKDPDLGKIEGRRRRGTTEDEMAGWHHQLNGHEFEYIPGVGDGQGRLVYCSPWGCRELDMTELNWTELSTCAAVVFKAKLLEIVSSSFALSVELFNNTYFSIYWFSCQYHQSESESKLLSHVRLFATPWTAQSMEFFRPEYWSG